MAGDEKTVRRYVWLLYSLVLMANYVGVAIMVWYGIFALRIYPENRTSGQIIKQLLVAMLPLVAIGSIHAFFRARRHIHSATGWLVEGRAPTTQERKDLCTLPTRLATNGTHYWISIGAVMFPYLFFVVRFRPGVDGVVRLITSYALIAIVPWSLSFVLTERALRPLFAAALTPDASLPKTMSIPGRLILAWVATSGIPTVGVFMLFAGQSDLQRSLAVPALFTIFILSTISGVTIAVFSGRSIIDPLGKVRSALRDVERGKLDVVIPVSESAELGELQVGVNRMVLGLRERERMRHLFSQHVGIDVAQRAIEGEHGLGGERLEATAMFVDVIGSSYLVQRENPDEVVEILNAFFDTVVRVVAAEGGFVNKFEGDGALCIFGAPVVQTDHAARALRAGESLQRELASMPGDIGAAIGISSGVVVAGNIGAADRYEYTVIGNPVHEASRLCDGAKLASSRILASETAIRSAGASDTGWVAADNVLLRGRSEMTATYTTQAE